MRLRSSDRWLAFSVRGAGNCPGFGTNVFLWRDKKALNINNLLKAIFREWDNYLIKTNLRVVSGKHLRPRESL